MDEPLNETLNAKNIHALHMALKRHDKEITELRKNVLHLQSEIVMLKGLVNTSNQLTAHLNGRGMGPTVNG